MELNKLVFAGLSLGCIAAAAGGGYLAARQSAPLAAPEAVAPAQVPSPTAPEQPVTESEGVITPSPVPSTASPTAIEAAETTVRREPAARPSRVTSRPQNTREASPRPTVPAPGERDAPTRTARTEPAASDSAPPAAPTPTSGGMWETRPTVSPERTPVIEPEPETPPPPPAPEFVELMVPADAVLGLQIERTISSETARVEDRVEARVTRDVRVGDRVAIPAGSVVQGSVMDVERGGKMKERARLGVRFHTVVLDSGTRLALKTDAVTREGASPAKESAAKIGGAAIGGAILGAILGGGKGAVIGGATGAAGGTAATMAGDRNPAVLTQGTTVTVRMQQPVTVTVEK